MIYLIQITETLQRTVEVESSSEIGAMRKVIKDYWEEKIVLDSGDFVEVHITPTK